jgi:hypothetical protein
MHMSSKVDEAAIAQVTASQGILGDLWRRRLDTLASGIANGDLYYLQIANAAEHISAEHQGRFLIELIQNANDQAVRQGLSNSRVSITRTERLIAVGNSGQPFDQARVDNITSIFKSDKTADVCIGNKGIGFKAVFQVADSAEIYSATTGGSLSGGPAIAFGMVRRPFDDPGFLSEIRALAETLLARDAERRRAIETRFAHDDATEIVLREAGRAAGFTFPLRLTTEAFRRRIQQLDLSPAVLAATQTLVVLPLDTAVSSSEGIAQAIDEICGDRGPKGGTPAAASFLFLPGIGRIDIVDHVRGFRAELEKAETSPPECLRERATLRGQRTSSKRTRLSDSAVVEDAATQDWWVAERMVGGLDEKLSEKETREREALREAIQTLRLPAENWRDVERVPVAVALPIPADADGADHAGHPVGANGRFCIGLPTQVSTGLPLWVSAHFHGKIDRTAIDFSNAYNTLLLEAAGELADSLLDRVKAFPSIWQRRLVTLAMERGQGELANRFYSPGGLARKAVVLTADGAFIEAKQLRIPRATDLAMFEVLAEGASSIEAYGFCLPDAMLLKNARSVLDALAEATEAPDACYLKRPAGRSSLLEHAAGKHRGNGPAFWEKFLAWVLMRFASALADDLADQAILPTAETDLSKPGSRVFFVPVNTPSRVVDGAERPHAVDDAGDELAAIDESVALLLRFFDDRAIRVRTGTARDYTPLAQRLAPMAGGGLVRRPRQTDLINDALIPALSECRDDNDKALALLRQALAWLVAMPQKSRQRVASDELLVPVRGPGGSWAWVEPDAAYLGEGWTDDQNVDLLTQAYGDRPGSQLVPWDRFERRASQLFGAADRNWWLQVMKEIGVWDCPRVIRSDRRTEVMRAYSYSSLTVIDGVRCPTPCSDGAWTRYLSEISRRRVQTRTGQDFYLREVAWIDGLETERIRSIVVEAMLRRPERYKAHQTTTLSRWGGEDSATVPALWVRAIRSEDWGVVPTSHGLRKPANAWFLPLEPRSTKADRFAFLPCVRAELSGSRELLSTLGVVTLEEAGIPRLTRALQELAQQKDQVEPEALRHYSALVHDLYEAIQVRLKLQDAPDASTEFLARPVPLLRGEQIACVALNDIPCLYVDDDPIRRRFLTGLDDAWILPKRSHQTYNELIQALRALLGAHKVLRVSECSINLQFVPVEVGTPFLDYMRYQYPARSIAEEVALLVVKGGNQATSPHENAFRQAWGKIGQARVVRGSFGQGSSNQSCFDARHAGGPSLLVDARLQPHEVVAEVWQILGPSYRDICAAYAQALKDERTDIFFADRGVSPADRTEIESAIGLGFEQLLRRYQAVCLALWRKRGSVRPVDEFHGEWARHARVVESARDWLQWDYVQAAIEVAVRRDDPAGSLALLEELQLTVSEWQSARRELGAQPYRFEATQRSYEMARSAMVGHLMAWFAYLLVPRASGAHGPTVSKEFKELILAWIGQLRASKVPDDVVELPLEPGVVMRRVASDALKLMGDSQVIGELPIFVEPLRELSMVAPTDVGALKLKDEPDKAATIYEVNDEATREQHAVAAVEAILKVANVLASKCGESLDTEAARCHPLVTLLSTGPLANRISVLAAVRYALEATVPRTAARMKDRQAFRDVDDWRTLWGKFEELGEIPSPVAPIPTKPTFEVLGTGWTEDEFAESAAQGPSGELVQRLEECVSPNLDLAAVRESNRDKLSVTDKRSRSRGGSGSGSGRRPPEALLKMLGAVGEHFVFQQMRRLLGDFDLTNWKSRAKEIFGYGEGDDSLGYDFEYYDMQGVLAGNALVPRCLIEVKSTAQDGTDTFEMSTNEWETAIRCHAGGEQAVYVILRVIRTATRPKLLDILVDPIHLHLNGVLDYSSRDLLVTVGRVQSV